MTPVSFIDRHVVCTYDYSGWANVIWSSIELYNGHWVTAVSNPCNARRVFPGSEEAQAFVDLDVDVAG